MKKIYLIIVMIILLFPLFYGCSQSEDESSKTETKEIDPNTLEITGTITGVAEAGGSFTYRLATKGNMYWIRSNEVRESPIPMGALYKVKGVLRERSIQGAYYLGVHKLDLLKNYSELDRSLLRASKDKDVPLMKELIQKGADIHSRSSDYYTPLIEVLYWSALDRHYLKDSDLLSEPFEAVELLIKSGADVNARDIIGASALFKAADLGFYRVAKLLIENGADWSFKYKNGNTPLHIAALRGERSLQVALLLIEKGADLTALNTDGKSPLDLATESIRKAMIKKKEEHQKNTN